MNTSPSQPTPAQAIIVPWVIWASILMGLFILQSFAAPKAPQLDEPVTQVFSIFSAIGVGLATLGMAIRWLVIPRLKSMQQAMPAILIGLAFCEVPGILGMFVVPAAQTSERVLLLSISIACVLLSAPVYAKRLISPEAAADA